MRRKKLTHAITFSAPPEMYEGLKKDADEYDISTSELMRRLSEDYLSGTHTHCRPNFWKKEIEDTNTPEAK
jgi:hypothetical protein